MERYYKILGISNSASKEEIKEAYHAKMKALHPDKVHGTSLEDTATFFAAEINEAYNYLMSNNNQSNSQHSTAKSTSTQKEETGYLEDDIFIEGIGVLKYSLSSDINIIKKAILKRTGQEIYNEIYWILNTELSENVKRAMNKHNVNYSMTTYVENSNRIVVINKRNGNNWYYIGYEFNIREQTKTKTNPTTKTNLKTNVRPKSKKKHNGSGLGVAIIAIIFLLIAWSARKNDSDINKQQKPIRTTTAAKVAGSNINTSEHVNIDKTLRIVSERLQQKTDVNGDGLINYIDAAVLFYQYYPNKSKVCIEYNYNPKTDMDILFNCVFTDGVWRSVEPLAYYYKNSSYWMKSIWGDKYDSRYNNDVTEKWKKYVR